MANHKKMLFTHVLYREYYLTSVELQKVVIKEYIEENGFIR